MLKVDYEIDHKTVKLASCNHNKVFFVQLNGAVAAQLIQSAEENGWWAWLYKDLYAHEVLIQSRKPKEFLESVRMTNRPLTYLHFLENVEREGIFIPGYWTVFVQGTVMEVIT